MSSICNLSWMANRALHLDGWALIIRAWGLQHRHEHDEGVWHNWVQVRKALRYIAFVARDSASPGVPHKWHICMAHIRIDLADLHLQSNGYHASSTRNLQVSSWKEWQRLGICNSDIITCRFHLAPFTPTRRDPCLVYQSLMANAELLHCTFRPFCSSSSSSLAAFS